MRRLILITLLAFFCKIITLSAQTTDSLTYFLNKSTMQTNVLRSYVDTVGIGLFNGINPLPIKTLGVLKLVHELNYFALNQNLINRSDSLMKKATRKIVSNHQIPILIINYQYDKIRENALSANLLTLQEGKYYDVFPRNESPFVLDTLFAAAPIKEKIYAGENHFLISREFLVTNLNDPTSIEIDFDDGNGFRNVNYGDVVAIN